MELIDKIGILADSAKYDVSCSSSGSQRNKKSGMLGNTALPGICHSWSEDGRCISLLKILFSNKCIYNCAYCVNRASNDFPRAELTPDELVKITINFYKRNYIEGLFLSSAVTVSPNHTMELMISAIKKLREEENFNGYIHLKAIPGADEKLLREAGFLVDRMSINLELPTSAGLKLLAPQKEPEQITKPMQFLKNELINYQPKGIITPSSLRQGLGKFMPAGQTTQMMIGATPDSDRTIIRTSQAMYQKLTLKRVYYSAYIPVVQNNALLPTEVKTPLLREHRLYQADWLLRFYGFAAEEILTESDPNLDMALDPKCQWALRHLDQFPIEINKANLETLLRIPGIGNVTARRIIAARKFGSLNYENLKALNVVLKRARFFITCQGKYFGEGDLEAVNLRKQLIYMEKLPALPSPQINFLQLYPEVFQMEDLSKILTGGNYARLGI